MINSGPRYGHVKLEGCVLRFTEQNVAGFGCNIRESLRGFQKPVCLEQACSLALVLTGLSLMSDV